MVKKAEAISKEQLEAKISDLQQKKDKIYSMIEQYTDVYRKMEGAIEILISMLQDLKEPTKPENNDTRTE